VPATTWGAPASYGDRLGSITYYGPSGQQSVGSWDVAKYVYDAKGQLVEELDPRLPSRRETYSDDELAAKSATVKNLAASEEASVPLASLSDHLRNSSAS
jgi:hypothetical protein